MATAKILQLHVGLVDSDPLIWRRFQISDQATLDDLHLVLQVVMGWDNSHLYAFTVGRDRYAAPSPMPLEGTLDATAKTLAELPLQSSAQFLYTYDFGDGWLHRLTLEDTLSADPEKPPPSCLAGARACPPEDSGGVWGYEGLLERLGDPEDPEYEELMDWIGFDFDSEAFSVAQVNQQLQVFSSR